MCPENQKDWVEANQRYLVAAVAVVRKYLEEYASPSGEGLSGDAKQERNRTPGVPEPWTQPIPSALEALCVGFRLSSFERDILLLCAGVELDSSFASLVASIRNDSAGIGPTFSLALAVLPDPHWSALTPAAPLRRFRMIEVSAGMPLTSGPLRIDERILHYLTGIQYLDERLSGLVEKFQTPGDLTPSYKGIVQRISTICSQVQGRSRLPVIQLTGPDLSLKNDICSWVCRSLGLNLFTLNARNIPADPGHLDGFLRLWEREAFLTQSGLSVDCHSVEPADIAGESSLIRLTEAVSGLVFVAIPEGRAMGYRPRVTLEIPLPAASEQRALWIEALGKNGSLAEGHLDRILSQFQLGPRAIRASCSEALGEKAGEEDGLAASLWNACRRQTRPQLERMAQRIEPAASWDDLVLPKMQTEILKEIAAHVRLRHRVYDSWGFSAKSSRGLGISALFTGSSGTGKTLAAEVLAKDLSLDLFRIDLSQVVSKYIGETEKNLRRVFDAAEAGGAILLFDEADALFGKRSEVKDSHDRYANIEVSYLLQRMESYRGLAILTTNMREGLDPAFLRRIRFIVQFPFPDTASRTEIWRRIFPAQTPTDHLDPERLSLLHVAGGNIRNIALHAAFLAAEGGSAVAMTHIQQAAKREYAKIEKQLSAAEMAVFGG